MTTKQSFTWKDGKFQESKGDKLRTKTLVGDEFIGGIEHPATREIVYSRSQFKKITKAHGLEECYGEPDKYWQKEDDSEAKAQDLEDDVVEALAKLNYGEGISDEELELCQQKNQQLEWEAENS